jgi:glycosyltransferase involved in cell wall biosynthesis
MRVLHVISGLDPENGGPSFAVVGMAQGQLRAGLDVSVLATWANESGFPLAEHMRGRGVKVEMVGRASGKLSRHPRLREAVDAAVAGADVVHVHALWEEAQHQAARACQRRGKPYVITPHGMLSPWSFANGTAINRWGKRVYMAMRLRRNLDGAAALHFTTGVERDLSGRLGLRPPAIIEPVGIDVGEFESLPARGAFRERFGQVGQRPMVLFLGRLSPQKGLDVLMPAFARFQEQDRVSNAVLVLAGPDYDAYGDHVRQIVRRHRLEDRVVFTGMLRGRERIEALVDADLFALTSHHENFGIVVAEAMAAGAPVLISKEVNIWEDVVEAGAGTAVEPEPSAAAAEMARWMADAAMRRAAGERGRAFALSRYGWDPIARNWSDHYRRLTGLTPPKAEPALAGQCGRG